MLQLMSPIAQSIPGNGECPGLRGPVMMALVFGLLFARVGHAQEKVSITEITPNVLVFATRTGNVIALVGPDGALLIGTPSADSTAHISNELANRTKSPMRYVVIAPSGSRAVGRRCGLGTARSVRGHAGKGARTHWRSRHGARASAFGAVC